MTVKNNVMRKYLQINVAKGYDNDGNTKVAKRSYKVKDDAADDKLFETANALGGLMANTVQSICLSITAELQQEI